jgi:hypothetical protein
LRKYVCIKVDKHQDVAKEIESRAKLGWRLHTYTCAQASVGDLIHHFLLFEKEI